jgi:hypothetical protein
MFAGKTKVKLDMVPISIKSAMLKNNLAYFVKASEGICGVLKH